MPSEDNSNQSIFECIKYGKIDDLEGIVRQGSSVNQAEKSRDKFTPLHTAAFYGSLECMHWLLWQGADPVLTTPKGWTPMMIAAIRGHYPCVQALIKNGVNVNARDNRGQTAAHMAATHGHSHTLQAILRGGADVSIQDTNGWTPVHAAAYHGRLGCLQFLKTSLGKLDECDNDGNTPAHLAAMEGNLPCLKYIISTSLNINSLISARNDQGDTPKTLAQQFYKDHVTEYLEAIEWDRDHPEQSENLAFPAHVAAFNGDIEHIKLLVDQGVININERDDKGSTMAHKAAGQGHLHVLQWLIENSADLKITNQCGEMPVDVAKRFAQLACIKLLEQEISGVDDDIAYTRESSFSTHTESKEGLMLSSQQKRDAKTRAGNILKDIEKRVLIARANYLQFGGKLEDVMPPETKSEHAVIKNISLLQNDLEFERMKREKLEDQLDKAQNELQIHIKSLREYETKVALLEKYIQHTNKGGKDGKKPIKDKPLKNSGSSNFTNRSNSGSRPSSQASRPQSSKTNRLNSILTKFLTTEQLKKLRNAFDRVDKNRNGYISRKEMQQIFRELDIRASNEEIERIIESADENHNHKIEFDEFALMMAKNYYNKPKDVLSHLSNRQIEELRNSFNDIDYNRSGVISKKELRRSFIDLDIKASDDEINAIINSMDSNHDGKIDFEEFARGMAKNYYKKVSKEDLIDAFRIYDLNNSGKINAEELRVVLSKNRFTSREEAEDLIRQVDRNKDGLVDINEFMDLINSQLDIKSSFSD